MPAGITTLITTTMTMTEDPACPGERAGRTERLVKLATWLSPAFPVGAFAYSHGLEWAIDSGGLRCADTLKAWLRDVVELGGGWTDAVLFVEGWRAAMAGDRDRMLGVADLAEALAPSRERHLETMAQGSAFLAGVAIWPCRPVEDLCEVTGGRAAYPVAVAVAAAGHAIPVEDALPVYLNGFVANLVSVAVRLVPLGQTAGLGVLAGLQPLVLDVSRRAQRSTLDDLGSSAVLSDIAAMRHEQQYSRNFRT